LNSGTKVNGTVVTPVNAIRNVPGAGIVVMGARTLLQDGTANRYVNTRRSLIFLNKSLKDLTEFALFENNDERLWTQLRSVLTVFLNGYWNQGGLRGETSAQAFFVKCDAENNPDDSIAQGEVHIEVGVALQYPAEFVVITLSQKTAN
jgi:phage tail sheath protein FI